VSAATGGPAPFTSLPDVERVQYECFFRDVQAILQAELASDQGKLNAIQSLYESYEGRLRWMRGE
jgi:hypothetical protein